MKEVNGEAMLVYVPVAYPEIHLSLSGQTNDVQFSMHLPFDEIMC